MLRPTLLILFISLPRLLHGLEAAPQQESFARLGIERDLSKLNTNVYRTWQPEEDCEVNADKAFEQAVKEANLDRELTDAEREKFKVQALA